MSSAFYTEQKIKMFLKYLNLGELTKAEREFKVDCKEEFPNLFVMGLPRSGTTFLTQLIQEYINVQSPNNLSALFWNFPLTGAAISKLSGANDGKVSDFTSNFGRTSGVNDPHEYSYFWRNMLRMENIESYDPNISRPLIDWSTLKKTLLNINFINGCGGLYKTMEYSAYYADEFASMFKYGYFIFIQRDPLEVAASIYNARTCAGDIQAWWGSVPKELFDLHKIGPTEQIALQVKCLLDLYKGALTIASEKIPSVVVQYEDLCTKTDQVLEQIVTHYNKTNPESLRITGEIYNTFKKSDNENVSARVHQDLKVALKNLNVI